MHELGLNPIAALWITWGLYWWASARGLKAVRRRESPASRAAHLVPLGLAGVLLALPSFPGWLGARFLPDGGGAYPLGVLLVALGLGFSAWARAVLGGNWSATVTLKADHQIIATGPYRRIRHPIYTGLLVAFIGCALARGEWRGVLAVLVAFGALWRKLRLEERWLTEAFGAAYADYRRRTWALLPFVW